MTVEIRASLAGDGFFALPNGFKALQRRKDGLLKSDRRCPRRKTGFDLGLNVWIVFMDGNVGVDLSLKL